MSNRRIKSEALVQMFAALSNPHRLALFERLCSCCAPGTSCSIDVAQQVSVGVLGAEIDIAASTLSHHLKTLRQAGLVRTERRGKQVLYWVDPEVLTDLSHFFSTPLEPREGNSCPSGACDV